MSPERAPADEVRLLDRLSVFAGGWSLGAARQVCAGDGLEVEAIVASHTALAATTMVVEAGGHPARFAMAETRRRSGRRRLSDDGGWDRLSARHAQWCVGLAEAESAEADYVVGDTWLRRLDPEADNFGAALVWASSGGDAQVGIRLVAALARYWALRGRLTEGLEWVDWAMAQDVKEFPPLLRATVVRRAALLHGRLGDPGRAQALAEEAAALYRDAGDARAAAVARNFIASCRNPTHALGGLDEAIALARTARDLADLAHLLCTRGQAGFFVGHLDAARGDFEECIAVARTAGRGDALLSGLLGLGRVHLATGDCAAASRELRDALALAGRADNRPNKAIALAPSGELSRLQGDYDRARTSLEAAVELDRASGEALAMARNLAFLAALEQALGAPDTARALFGASLELCRSSDGPAFHEARCLLGVAATLPAAEVTAAQGLVDQAGALAAANDDRQAVASCLRLAARLVRLSDEDADTALGLCKEALRLYEAVGDLPGLAACVEDTAGLFAARRWYEAAASLFSAAEALRETGGYARAPVERDAHSRAVALVAEALGPRWQRARIEGRSVTPADAVALAYERSACAGRPRGKQNATGWASLTPGEREVARLVTTGLSNDQAAARLFVSRRTVESHLARIYPKLGVHSRRELAGWIDDAQWTRIGKTGVSLKR